ncbi:uncharacterized protein LOC121238111 [Juglans microcarpa x Juglans regia]|uniref:uncharacterized protein LOC121238111 n=1 Tax=Juglans microcarpa x Juglans regia TaxID=2249226 RepID=UPI001B7E2DE4|nr:uncharacterized protein LOC121238111 [Juglans microcarpa x Juglans regia]
MKKVDVSDGCCFCDADTENLPHVRSLGNLQDLATFFSIASSIWFRRNRKRHEDDILEARKVFEQDVTMQRLHGEMKPPAGGSVKLNVDGVVFRHLYKAGVGAILRDAQGKVIMSVSKGEWEVEQPEVIEFMAALRGLQLISHMGITHLVLESDCLLVVKELNEASTDQSPQGYIIREIRLLLDNFIDVTVCHVNRLGNGVAHGLARHTWIVDSIIMWWDGFPDFISQAI